MKIKLSFLTVLFLLIISTSTFSIGKSDYFVIETDSNLNETWFCCIDSFDCIGFLVDSSDKDSGIIQGKQPGTGSSDSKDSYISVKVREKDNKRVITIMDRPGKLMIYLKKSQKPILVYVEKIKESLNNAVVIQQE
jgi:hypothetical protein